MRPLWTVAEVTRATGGRPEGLPDIPLNAVSIDSRELGSEALFVAIRGDTHDGHDFVARALEAGASAALVSEDYFKKHGGERLIVVNDPLTALGLMGMAARSRNRGQIIAVTGSAGKTTTKEALRCVFEAIGVTHASIKSFNNHWGVPLMLSRLPAEAQFGIFEIGMNHAGEITPLVQLVRPHIAIITTVAAAHLEFFDSVAGIAAAKAEIFTGLEPGGIALINADHDWLHVLFAHARAIGVAKVVTYGYDGEADWRITRQESTASGSTATILHEGKSLALALEVPGKHMVANAVAAVAAASLSGEGTEVALRALKGFGAPEGRGLTQALGPAKKPLLLVDESYNANVASMGAALDVYAAIKPPGGAKVLVLGDMLEMGPQGVALHAGLDDAVRKTGATRVYLVGRAIMALQKALSDSADGHENAVEVIHADSVDDIKEPVLAGLAYGDAVMVKGSKGVRLASLVEAIRQRFQSA